MFQYISLESLIFLGRKCSVTDPALLLCPQSGLAHASETWVRRVHSFAAFPAPTWSHALLNPWTHEPGFLKNLKNLRSVGSRPSICRQTNTPAGLTHSQSQWQPCTAEQEGLGGQGGPKVKVSEKLLGRSIKLSSTAVSASSLQLFGPQLLPCKMITQGPARWSLRLLLTHPQWCLNEFSYQFSEWPLLSHITTVLCSRK